MNIGVLIGQAVVVASGVWVLVDARKHKVGKTEGGGLFNMSATQWSVVTIALWIVGFPAYLFKRSALIERAAAHPVEPDALGTDLAKVAGTALLFFFLFGGWGAATRPAAPAQLPTCDGADVGKLLEQMAANAAKTAGSAAPAMTFGERREVSFQATPPQRTCSVTVVAQGKTEVVQIHVNWLNQSAGQFGIQVVPPKPK